MTMAELDIDAEDDKSNVYDPSEIEATRGREQGLGVGERDLQRQRDAHRPVAPPEEDEAAADAEEG
jgi:hypothetical protein